MLSSDEGHITFPKVPIYLESEKFKLHLVTNET